MSDVSAYVLRTIPDRLHNRPYAYVSLSPSPNFNIEIAGVNTPGMNVHPVDYNDDTGQANVIVVNPPYASNLDSFEGRALMAPMPDYPGMFRLRHCVNGASDIDILKRRLTELAISQFTLDFNIHASRLLVDSGVDAGTFFSIEKSGVDLVLQASLTRVDGGTNQLSHKGGEAFSATISPNHFYTTGFDPGHRYHMMRINEQKFLLERFDKVSHYRAAVRYDDPVVTVSYIRPKNSI